MVNGVGQKVVSEVIGVNCHGSLEFVLLVRRIHMVHSTVRIALDVKFDDISLAQS